MVVGRFAYRTISAAAVRASSGLARSSFGRVVAKREVFGIPNFTKSSVVTLVFSWPRRSGNNSICGASLRKRAASVTAAASSTSLSAKNFLASSASRA